MKKNNSKIFTIIGLAAVLGISYLTATNNTNQVKASSVTFSDDFNSYNSYNDMSSKWINGFFVPDPSRTMDQTSCSASNNEIVNAPKDVATHGKVYHMKGVEYNYVSVKNTTPQRFEVDFDYYLASVTNSAWFGLTVHSVERGNNNFPPRYARCTDCYNSLLTIQTNSTNASEYRAYATLEIPGDMIDTQIGGSYGGEGSFKFTNVYQTWHHAKFTCTMNTSGLAIYSLFVDNQLIGKIMNEDSKFNHGGYISLTNCLCDAYYDNFVVTSLDNDPLPGAPIIQNTIFTRYTQNEYNLPVDYNNGEVIALFDATTDIANPSTVNPSYYTVDYQGENLKFSNDFINELSVGKHTFILSTDGGKTSFDITITNPDVPPTLGETMVNYKLGSTSDVNVSLDLHGIPFTSLKFGNSTMKKGTYEVTNSNLIIKNDFLEGLTTGAHSFTVTSEGGSSILVVNVSEDVVIEPPLVLDTRSTYLLSGGYDLTIKVNFKKRPLSKIAYIEGNRDLVETTDFLLNPNSIVLNSGFLDSLAIGEHNFELYTDGGKSAFKVVVSSEMEEPKEAPTMIEGLSFDSIQGQEKDIVVPVNYHGETLTSLTCDGALVDASNYVADKNGNSLLLLKSYLETLTYKSNPYTMLVSTDGGSVAFDLYVKKAPTPIDPEYDAPVVVYTQTREYTISESGDIVAAIDLKGAPLESLKDGNDEVLPNNYVCNNDTLILFSTYLDTLEAKNHTFKLLTSGGEASFVVNVKEKVIPPVIHEAPLIAGSSFDYKMNSGSYVVVLDARGEEIISFVLDDTKSLVSGVDYTYNASDFALTLNASLLNTLTEGVHKFEITTLGGPAIFNIDVLNDEVNFDIKQYSNEFVIDVDLGGETVLNVNCKEDSSSTYDLVKNEDYIIRDGKVVLTNDFILNYEAGCDVLLTISTASKNVKCRLFFVEPAPSFEFDSYDVTVGSQSFEMNVNLYGEEIIVIKCSDSYSDFDLEEGSDYILGDNKITLTEDFLNLYTIGEYSTLEVVTAKGSGQTTLNFKGEAPTIEKESYEIAANSNEFVVNVNLHNQSLTKVTSITSTGETQLTKDTHYKLEENKVVLLTAYLSSFAPNQEATLKIETASGSAQTTLKFVAGTPRFEHETYDVPTGSSEFSVNIELFNQNVTSIICRDGFDNFYLQVNKDYTLEGNVLKFTEEYLSFYMVHDHAQIEVVTPNGSALTTLNFVGGAPVVEKESYNVNVGSGEFSINVECYGEEITSIYCYDSEGEFELEKDLDYHVNGNKIIFTNEFLSCYQVNDYADLDISTARGTCYTSLEFVPAPQVNVGLIVGLSVGGVALVGALTAVILIIKKKHSYSI